MNKAFVLFLAAWAAGHTALAATESKPAAKPDLAKAQQTVTQVCAACHGADGNSTAAANPSLAGQHAAYLTAQLKKYKSGVRKNAVMAGMVATLDEAEMVALGVYFSEQKPKPRPVAVKGEPEVDLLKLGQAIYRGGNKTTGLPACAACHSPNGAGIPAQYPRLAGQYADYTASQLKAFKTMERGGSITVNGKPMADDAGKVMHEIAARMSDTEIRAVALFTAGVR